MQELHLYPHKKRVALGAIGVTGLFLGCLWLLMRGPNPDSVFRLMRSPFVVYAVALGGLLLFGWMLWFGIQRLRKPQPAVSLTAQGVRVDGFAGQFSAPWSAFSGYRRHASHMLVLMLHDSNAFIAGQAAGRPQASARALSQRFGSPFLIDLKHLEADAAEVEQHLSQRLPLAA